MKPPKELREREIWMTWAMSNDGRKLLRAPWKLGHSYPAEWGSDVVKRPETTYERAERWWELSARALDNEAPLPGDCQNDVLQPAILLPHDPPEASQDRLCFIDYDDVRTEEDGFTDEAERLIRDSGAWTEISQSGEGAHSFVKAKLPENVGRVIADLDEQGHIEIYDSARQAAMTFNEVGFSGGEIPHAQEFVDHILEEYYDGDSRRDEDGEDTRRSMDGALDRIIGDEDEEGRSRSAYHDARVSEVVSLAGFDRESNGVKTGPHPSHGPLHSDRGECTNTAVFDDETWYCHAHDSTGRAIELVACMETPVSCSQLPGDSVGELEDDEVLTACLEMSDCVPEGAKPPYAALRAVARDLGFDVGESLDSSEYEVALDAYRHRAYE